MGSPYQDLRAACERARQVNDLRRKVARVNRRIVELDQESDAFARRWVAAFGASMRRVPGTDREVVSITEDGVEIVPLDSNGMIPLEWPDATPAIDPDDAEAATAWTGQTIPAEAVTAGGEE